MAYLRPFRTQVALSVVMMAVSALSALAGPYLIKVAIDRYIIAERNMAGLNTVAALYIASQLVYWLGSYWSSLFMTVAGQTAIHDLRQDLFSHLQRLSVSYYDRRPAGVIMSRATNDVAALNELLSSGLLHVVADLFTLIGIVTVMLVIDARLALYSFAILPLLVLVSTVFRNRVLSAYRRVRAVMANVNASLQESISGVRVTQSLTREEENIERFDRTNYENLQANMQAASLFSVYIPTVEVVGAIGTGIVLWFGGLDIMAAAAGVEAASFSVGGLVAFLAYVNRFYQPIRDLSHVYNVLQSAMAAAEKIFSIMETEPEVREPAHAPDLPRIRGAVRFEGVSFAYNPGEFVLRDVSLEIPAAHRVALVGPTGAGKTTLVHLLVRFYEPQEGIISIDGYDIRRYSLASLRRQVGLVLQEPFLFSGTVAENIRYGNPAAGDGEVEAAARAVGAHEFIAALEKGYDTEVHERGGTLSAGQRQLISLARLLLKDPRIVLLDEATASIDPATEQAVHRALEVLLRGRTSLVIAHRLATVQAADLILVLEGGRIVERGTHPELLRRGGVYRRLWTESGRAGMAGIPPSA